MKLGRVRSQQSKHGTRLKTNAAQQKALQGTATQSQWAQTKFAKDLLRSRWDTHYFAEELLGLKGHGGQDRIWTAILMRDRTGWRPRYLTICCAAGNQAGKTLGLAIALLHSTIFKLGLEPPNPLSEKSVRRWAQAPYDWYHFAIAQETAELTYIAIVKLLSGIHEGQPDGCPLTEMLGAEVADWSRKYRGEYLWIVLHEALGGGNIHFRTTGEKGIGSLGKQMNGASYDECGFDPNFDFVVNEVLHLRRLATAGQLVLASTSTEGLTQFADKWFEGDPENPDKKPDSMSLRMSTRENIGYGLDQSTFDRLVRGMPAHLVPQNIDGMFIEGRSNFFGSKSVDQMFKNGLEEIQPPQYGHRYVQGVDPATTFDSCWSIVLDSTLSGVAFGVFPNYINGRTSGPVIAGLATASHHMYNDPERRYICATAIDATGFGGKMFRDLLYIKPLYSVEFGGTRGKKLKLLNDLKQWIERGQLTFPRVGKWLELRRQLLGYKLDDKNLKTDAVMALAVAVHQLQLNLGGAVEVMPFDFFNPGNPVIASPATPPLVLGGPHRPVTYTSLADMKQQTEG